jgi:capsular polysaccharide biosynthesis protein
MVLALAIAALLPDRYTAETVLIVPASSTDLGNVDEATKLARTYAQLIPRDDGIVAAIGRSLGMAPASVERRLSVANEPGQSLLHLRFRGRTSAEAIRGARNAAQAITSDDLSSESIETGSMIVVRLPRRATSTGTRPFGHVAESVLVVPSRPKVGGPGNAGEASNLATTYADLIPEDRVILRNVAAQLKLDPETVRKAVSVTHDFDTSLVRISFSNSDPRVALAGARILAGSVTRPKPVSPRITPRSLEVVHIPTAAATQAMSRPKVAILGLILGLALGLVLLLARERSDRRIDDVETLGVEAGCAASTLKGVPDATVVALLDRWQAIVGKSPTRIALLAASERSEAAAQSVAARLAPASASQEPRIVSSDASRGTRDQRIVLEVGGTPGGSTAGERVALGADLIVLVVVEGTRSSEIAHTLTVLDAFGTSPSWALLVSSADRVEAPSDVDSEPPTSRAGQKERASMRVVIDQPAGRRAGGRRARPAQTLGTSNDGGGGDVRAADQR